MKLFPYVPSFGLFCDHLSIQIVKKWIEKQDKKSYGKQLSTLTTFESILPSISQFLFLMMVSSGR